jgi:hypothetical protein
MVLSRKKANLKPASFSCKTNVFDIQLRNISEGKIENQKEKFEVECNLMKQPVESGNQENKPNFHEPETIRNYQAESSWEEFEFFQF